MSKPPDATPPRWELLPHDPVGFFELADDFDRKSLKRKYNQYIRQFKPEKSPAEFQKIRAAYEQLDGQLRYGQNDPGGVSSFQWDQASQKPSAAEASAPPSQASKTDEKVDELNVVEFNVVETEHSTETPSSPKRQTRPQAIPLHQRIEFESPVDLYRELQEKKFKTPYDYYALALISDIIGNDPYAFFKLLLAGIQEFPDERGLLTLLQNYFKSDIPNDKLPNILLTVSKVISNDRFYFLTERLWDRLLRSSGFTKFRRTLEQCESNLDEFRITGKLVFYLHIGMAAIWKAPQDWTHQLFEFLDGHAIEIPEQLQHDVELLYQLREYLNNYRSSPEINTNVTLQKIHQTISEYFLHGGIRGDQAVIGCQNEFAQNATTLLNSFGPNDGYNEQQLMLWDFINDEVCQRNDVQSSIHPRKLREKIFDLMNDLNLGERWGGGDELRYYSVKYGPYVVAALGPFLLFSPLLFLFCAAWFVALLLSIAATLAVHVLYKPHERYERYIEKRSHHTYYRQWRGRFVQLFEETQASHADVTEALVDVIKSHAERLGFAVMLYQNVPIDVGLHLYASAVRYVR